MAKKYEVPEEEPQMVRESMSLTLTQGQAEQVEALWTLIKNQGFLVQEALFERFSLLFNKTSAEKETAQHLYVKESLHRAFENMHEADLKGEHEQTLDEFLDEL